MFKRKSYYLLSTCYLWSGKINNNTEIFPFIGSLQNLSSFHLPQWHIPSVSLPNFFSGRKKAQNPWINGSFLLMLLTGCASSRGIFQKFESLPVSIDIPRCPNVTTSWYAYCSYISAVFIAMTHILLWGAVSTGNSVKEMGNMKNKNEQRILMGIIAIFLENSGKILAGKKIPIDMEINFSNIFVSQKKYLSYQQEIKTWKIIDVLHNQNKIILYMIKNVLKAELQKNEEDKKNGYAINMQEEYEKFNQDADNESNDSSDINTVKINKILCYCWQSILLINSEEEKTAKKLIKKAMKLLSNIEKGNNEIFIDTLFIYTKVIKQAIKDKAVMIQNPDDKNLIEGKLKKETNDINEKLKQVVYYDYIAPSNNRQNEEKKEESLSLIKVARIPVKNAIKEMKKAAELRYRSQGDGGIMYEDSSSVLNNIWAGWGQLKFQFFAQLVCIIFAVYFLCTSVRASYPDTCLEYIGEGITNHTPYSSVIKSPYLFSDSSSITANVALSVFAIFTLGLKVILSYVSTAGSHNIFLISCSIMCMILAIYSIVLTKNDDRIPTVGPQN